MLALVLLKLLAVMNKRFNNEFNKFKTLAAQTFYMY